MSLRLLLRAFITSTLALAVVSSIAGQRPGADNRPGPNLEVTPNPSRTGRKPLQETSARTGTKTRTNPQRPTPNAQPALPPFPPIWADTSRLVRAWDIHAYDRP